MGKVLQFPKKIRVLLQQNPELKSAREELAEEFRNELSSNYVAEVVLEDSEVEAVIERLRAFREKEGY